MSETGLSPAQARALTHAAFKDAATRSAWNVQPLPKATGTAGQSWNATVSREAPRVPWNVFISKHFRWNQGEHVGLIGPTGQGKTTTLMHLLPRRKYVVVFASKPRDSSMDRLIEHEKYRKMTKWVRLPLDMAPRRVLWPPVPDLHDTDKQRDVFLKAMSAIYREGNWCLAIDELWWFINKLNLGAEVKTFLTQGRALGLSLVVATQRPAFVPLEVYDQSTHLFFWRDNDERNLNRLSGISWRNATLIRTIIAELEQYQMLYVDTRTGKMFRTRIDLRGGS